MSNQNPVNIVEKNDLEEFEMFKLYQQYLKHKKDSSAGQKQSEMANEFDNFKRQNQCDSPQVSSFVPALQVNNQSNLQTPDQQKFGHKVKVDDYSSFEVSSSNVKSNKENMHPNRLQATEMTVSDESKSMSLRFNPKDQIKQNKNALAENLALTD